MAEIFPAPQFVKIVVPSRAAALTFAAVNLLTTTLSGPVQDPFKPVTFPNPVIRRVTQTDIPQNLRNTLFVPQIPPPDGKRTLPEVHRAKLTRFIDQTQSLQGTLFAPLQPQGKSSTEIPVRRVRNSDAFIPPSPLNTLYAPLIPTGDQLLAEVAPRKLNRIIDPIPNLAITTLLPDYIFSEVQRTRIIPKSQTQDYVAPNLLTTTLSAATPPDTNNIFRPLQVTRIVRPNPVWDFPVPNLLTSTLGTPPVQNPFHQDDWQNPRPLSRFREADNPANLYGSTLAVTAYIPRIALTSSQAARRVRVQTPFDVPNTIPLLIPPLPPPPISQTEWPNPRVNSRWREAQIPPNLILSTLAPIPFFHKTDFLDYDQKINRGRTQVFDFPNTNGALTLPIIAPYNQLDWPNPVRRKYNAPVFTFPNTESLVNLPNTKPFHQDDHPNPMKFAFDKKARVWSVDYNTKILPYIIPELRTIITGIITDAAGNPATSGYVIFKLMGGAAEHQYYRVLNTNVLVNRTATAYIDATGHIKAADLVNPFRIYGNDVITPAGSWYKVVVAPNNTIQQVTNLEYIHGATYDITNPEFR